MSPQGEIIWERTFDFTTGADFIYEMKLDSEGKLVAIGRDQLSANTVNFIMRYDFENNLLLWSKKISDPAYTRLEGILEVPNQNFVIYGTNQHSGGLDNLIFQVDRNNGNLIWMKSYNTGSTDAFYDATIKGNAIYTANVQRYGSTLDKIRTAVSKLDFSGNQLWTRNYIKNQTGSARVQSTAITSSNDTLVVFGHGNLTGPEDAYNTLQLYTTSIDGNIYWAKEYKLPGSYNHSYEIIQLADGYLLQGTFTQANRTEIFLMKVSKQGDKIWAKSIGGPEDEACRSFIVHDGYIYFAGHTSDVDASQDIIFGKLGMNGESYGVSCDFISDVNVTVNNLANPYDGQNNLQSFSYTHALTAASITPIAVASPIVDVSGCGCQSPSLCNNLLLNGNLENGITGWSATGDVTTTSDAHTGASAAKICSTSTGSIGQLYPAQAGDSFTASLWAKSDYGPNNANIQLRFMNSSFTPLTAGNDQQYIYSNFYEPYNLSAVAPPGTAYVHLLVWKQGTACAYIDDVEMCKDNSPPIFPDLSVSGVAVLNSPVPYGGSMAVEYTLSNLGTSAVSGNYNVKLYVSTSNVINSNSTLIATFIQQNTPLGYTATLPVSATLPTSLAAGNYYLIVKADADAVINESDENNNTVATAFTIAPPNPCTGNIILSSQAQVNAFPGCPLLNGNLTISGADIQNLTPLSVLQGVSGVLSISTNTTLTSLNGLNNLTSIGGLNISNNPLLTNLTALSNVQGDGLTTVNISQNDALTSLNGLQGITGTDFLYVGNKNLLNLTGLNGLTHVDGAVQLMSNKKLVSLSGLSNLAQVSGDFLLLNAVKLTNLDGLQSLTTVGSSFNIQFDSSLVSLSGLENLQSVGGLRVSSNPKLLTLTALSSLTQAPILNIQGNALLSECCSIVPLLNGNVTIQSNLTGCNSAQEIVAECSTGGGGGNSIDLSIGATSPTTAPIYTSYPTAITITNSGGIPATGVKVVCQKPNGVVYTGGNEFTASQGTFGPLTSQEWVVGTLAPGASATLTVNYFLLQATPPTVYAQVTAANEPDADSTPNNGTPPTPNEDDEASSAGTPPPPPAQPDLSLADFVAPASTPPGAVTYTFTLKNTGNTTVQGTYQIGVFLSTDNVLSSDDYSFTAISEQNTAVGSFNRTGTLTIPTGQAGNYFLILKADAGSTITESNEGNNLVTRALTITGTPVQQPDLQLGALNAPVNLVPNTPTSIDFQLSNTGTIPVQGSFQTDIFLSTDNAISADDQLLLSMPEQNIIIGAVSRSASITVGSAIPVGNYYLLLKADGSNVIAEGNENNNIVSTPIVVGMNCNSNYILSTQAEVDAFPACNFVNGNLRIAGADIVDLTPLSGLASITGLLEIQNNTTLASLDGLHNLKAVGGLLMSNNPVLASLSPLSKLSGDALLPLIIESQAALTNLHGLEGITGANYLKIQGNTNLQTLTGLDNLAIVRGEFLLTQNPALLHLDQLGKLTTLQSTLILDDNPLLGNLHGLSHLTSIGGTLFLNGTNSLTDLQGLENVASMFAVDIKDNEFLQNLDALSGIISLNSLRIRNNTVLSDCCGLYPVLSANGVSGVIEISGNPSGCNSALDIITSCVPSGVDLQLTMSATNPNPGIYTSFPVKLTITNAGGQAATGVEVAFPRPAGVVYEGGNEFTASKGAFNAFGNERWYLGDLAAGESATINVSYFLLTSNALHPYAQVFACNEPDSDSSPNNGTSPTPNEDDEATIGINSLGNGPGNAVVRSDNRRRLNFDRIYPNPTQYLVTFDLYSYQQQAATLDIYDQQGRLVRSMQLNLEEGQNLVELWVSDWKSGTYNLTARGEKSQLPAYGRFLKVWEE